MQLPTLVQQIKCTPSTEKNVANMYTIHTNIKRRLNAYKWCHDVPRQTTLH